MDVEKAFLWIIVASNTVTNCILFFIIINILSILEGI